MTCCKWCARAVLKPSPGARRLLLLLLLLPLPLPLPLLSLSLPLSLSASVVASAVVVVVVLADRSESSMCYRAADLSPQTGHLGLRVEPDCLEGASNEPS